MYSEKLSPKKNLLLFILLGLGITIWVLSIAAANVDWYKEEYSGSGVTTTVKLYLDEIHTEGCFSGTCASTSQKWSDAPSLDKVVNVHKATRGLIIAGLILNSFFWVFLVLYIVKEFVPKLELILRTKQSLFLLIGYLLLLFSFILLAVSFLTYIGLSKAYADDLKASGGTVFHKYFSFAHFFSALLDLAKNSLEAKLDINGDHPVDLLSKSSVLSLESPPMYYIISGKRASRAQVTNKLFSKQLPSSS